MKTVHFQTGEIIFKQGDYAESMFDVLSGRVGVYKDYGTVDEKKLAEIGENESFGEMGFLEYCPRSATVVALCDCELAEIGDADIRSYFKDKPEKLLKIMKELSHRLRETTENYLRVCRAFSDREKANPGDEAYRDAWDQISRCAAFYDGTWL